MGSKIIDLSSSRRDRDRARREQQQRREVERQAIRLGNKLAEALRQKAAADAGTHRLLKVLDWYDRALAAGLAFGAPGAPDGQPS
jgi:hypothetical protein